MKMNWIQISQYCLLNLDTGAQIVATDEPPRWVIRYHHPQHQVPSADMVYILDTDDKPRWERACKMLTDELLCLDLHNDL